MIDQNEIDAIVKSKVAEAVAEQVANLFKNDAQLLANLRSQAVSLLVRNFNLDQPTKKNMAGGVAKAVAEQLLAGDNDILDANLINTAVSDNIANATNGQVGDLIKKDPKLLRQLKTHAIADLVRRIDKTTNIDNIIGKKLVEQFATQFEGTGIHSTATKHQLMIEDDNVIVGNGLIAHHTTTKDMHVKGKLLVTGTVDTSSAAWDGLTAKIKHGIEDTVSSRVKGEIVDTISAHADALNFSTIQMGGKTVLAGNTLGSQITESSLNSIGTLENIRVTGQSDLGSLHVTGKRVGVNTTSPNSALAVWDDEVEVIVGKYKEQTAYIGTNKPQGITIGVNRGQELHIGTDGVVTIQKLKLGIRSLGHGSGLPGYSGTPGDIVLNTQLTLDNPIFAWYCLGAFSWVPLKATI